MKKLSYNFKSLCKYISLEEREEKKLKRGASSLELYLFFVQYKPNDVAKKNLFSCIVDQDWDESSLTWPDKLLPCLDWVGTSDGELPCPYKENVMGDRDMFVWGWCPTGNNNTNSNLFLPLLLLIQLQCRWKSFPFKSDILKIQNFTQPDFRWKKNLRQKGRDFFKILITKSCCNF